MRIAFYKSKYGNWFHKAINRFSGNRGYSHCELIIDPQTTVGASYFNKGVHTYNYENILNNPMWDTVEIDLEDKYAINYALSKIGTKYDTLGVVLYFVGLKMADDKNKVWCSEFIVDCMNGKYVFLSDPLIMPNELFDILIKEGGSKNLSLESSDLKMKTIDRYGRVEWNR